MGVPILNTQRLDLIDIALQEYGLTEIPGEENNPRILTFFKMTGHEWVQTDETAWCSAFMNWVCLKAGVRGSGELNARSWLNVGKEVKKPKPGNIVIFWREHPQSWKGHVGLFINEHDLNIYTLGGNQNNKVCIKPYSVDRVIGYREIT